MIFFNSLLGERVADLWEMFGRAGDVANAALTPGAKAGASVARQGVGRLSQPVTQTKRPDAPEPVGAADRPALNPQESRGRTSAPRHRSPVPHGRSVRGGLPVWFAVR